MATLTIDGKPCTFEHPEGGKKMILQVALDNGVELPHYCYHPGLSIVASCRICLAEVASPNPRNDNKVELIPKLVPTCQTPAADGMVVHSQSPKAIANQKAVMEYLLINHPLDCPVCDQAGECYLQDYSYKYGRSVSRFMETKIKQPKKDLGPNVLLYSDRCIMCSRCVRFTREVTGTGEIGVFGRGSAEQIDVFPGKALDNELSANVIDICPVGALLDKDFLMSMRVWNLSKTASIDGITASGDNLSIEHNDGKIYRIKPRTNMDVNQWWTSDEIRFGWKFVHREDRLRSPMHAASVGESTGTPVPVSLQECDWNQAYREIADHFTTPPLSESASEGAGTPHAAPEERSDEGAGNPHAASEERSDEGAGILHAASEQRSDEGAGIPHAASKRSEGAGKDNTSPRLALLVSPMLSCEEAYLLGKLIFGLDENALVGVGPIPIVGEDKTFPGGYTVRAEKCPNSRGVRRALECLTDDVLTYEQWVEQLGGVSASADMATKVATPSVLLTGNYPDDWAPDELVEAVRDKFTVLIDTLPGKLSDKVNVLLPGATWAEKTGVFENAQGRLQSFLQAIPVIELAKPEGQIALDLLAACGLARKQRYDADRVRREMGDAFVTDVHHPPSIVRAQADMEYVEL